MSEVSAMAREMEKSKEGEGEIAMIHKLRKRLRKIWWVFHEVMSPLGHVVWLEHRIQELEEAIVIMTKKVK